MNVSLYIARRYLVSRKSHNIINVISGISIVGVTMGTMALIIVLSVFNGFEKLVISLFNSFDPDLRITALHGKTFSTLDFPEEKLRKIPGVLYLSEVIEENALLKFKEKQCYVTLKGVSEEFTRMTGIDTMMAEGEFALQKGDLDMAVLGYGVAGFLNANLNDYKNPIAIYVPNRMSSFSGGFENAFSTEVIFPSGAFAIQKEFDVKYVILPLRFIKKLLHYDREVTAIELGLDQGTNTQEVQKKVQSLLGSQFVVKNRFQQQEVIYKIMKTEKWGVFLIVGFILFIATFNMVGSLSMLILDKKKDIAVLKSMGASDKLIRRIFMMEGMLISLTGAMAGLILGAVICWAQLQFGLIKLGSDESTFVVSTYPVQMQLLDFLLVLATVLGIGMLAAWYPVYNIRKIHTAIVHLD